MVQAEILIDAPPHVVREIFLDFPNLSKWHDCSFFQKIEVITPGKTTGLELVPGDHIQLTIPGGSFKGLIQENDPKILRWLGSIPYIVSGSHAFEFAPHSSGNPDQCRFVQSEKFTGLLTPLMWFYADKTEQGWMRANRDLKAAAEKAWASRQGKSGVA